MPSQLDALWAFLVAAVVTWLITPFVAGLARQVGAVDEPKERGLHERIMPRLGGVAILAGIVAAALIWLPVSAELNGILLSALAITAVGVADDLLDLPAWLKLLGQAGAALIAVDSGIRVEHVTLPFIGALSLGWSGWALTVIGMVAVMNVINFSDGVDGLAAGVCTIAALTFTAIALSLDRVEAGVLAAITAGAAIGFLRHNFHPASIFMGDSGSNLLGLMLAVIAIQGVLKTAAVVALFFPMAILAVPILDSGFVIAKRIKYREPIYRADRWHFHHRFASIGFSQRKTVLYLYGWTLTLAGLALALRFVPYSDDHGHFSLGWTLVMIGFGLIAVAASIYLVLVLEILKLRRFRKWQILRERKQRGEELPDQALIDAGVARELETGEFEAISGPKHQP